MPTKKGFLSRAPITVTFAQQVAAASLLTTYQLFANPLTGGEVYEFLGFDYSYDVASSSGTLDLRVTAVTVASTAGSTVVGGSPATASLSATARTARKGVITTTAGNRLIMPGSMLTMIFAGTLTGLVGFNVTVWLKAQRGIRAR